MAVGEKYPFLQFSALKSQVVDTAPVTVTFCTSAQPDPEVYIVNASTATVYIGMGSFATSSAAISTGVILMPANQHGSVRFLRTGGNTKLSAVTIGATQTTTIKVIGGEGGI